MADDILDLSDVLVGDFIIKNRAGTKEWRVDNDLPCRTAWALLKYGDKWDTGAVDEEAFTYTMQAMQAILQRQQPDTTIDDVIDNLSVVDVQRVIRYLQTRVGQPPDPRQDEAAATQTDNPSTTQVTQASPSSTEQTPPPMRLTMPRPRATSRRASPSGPEAT